MMRSERGERERRASGLPCLPMSSYCFALGASVDKPSALVALPRKLVCSGLKVKGGGGGVLPCEVQGVVVVQWLHLWSAEWWG